MKNAINEAIKNYEHTKFSEKKYNARDFFKYIDNKTSQKQPISYLISNENMVTENEEKANLLSAQYSSVFSDDNNHIPALPPRNLSSVLGNFVVTDQDIVKSIAQMNPSSAPGCDGIHPRIIRELSSRLVYPFKLFFTYIIIHCVIAIEWKVGIIVPLMKPKSDPHLGKSYRPICLTSVLSKIFERVIHHQIFISSFI